VLQLLAIGQNALAGQFGVMMKLWSQEDYNNVLLPAVTYIIGRILSKTAKSNIS